MNGFIIKFLCVFYLAVVVHTRSINSNSKKLNKFSYILNFLSRNDSTERENKAKREVNPVNNEIDQILSNVTEKVNHLMEKYEGYKYKTYLPKLDKNIYEQSARKTTTRRTTVAAVEEMDFLGTEQIEALLNDIKAKAIQMVAEQNPSVTDIISNTVTEATFEADPILTHIEMSSPGYALTTFVCLNNIESTNIENKRTANDTNIILISNKDSKHNVSARSVKEDAFTIAQNMEDLLQKELKSIYAKVKNKVSKDFHKEVKKVNSTLRCESSKVIDQVTKKVTGPANTSHLLNKATSAPRPNRGFKTTKPMTTSTKQLETTTITPTVDDFAMLTLYEQILAKTHENNVMKMLTTNNKRKTDETIRLSKRNPETLTDLTLKEDIRRMNDDGENIPSIDYNDDIILPESSSDYPSDLNTNYSTAEPFQITQTTAAPLEDTSFEGLSDKISYKDYVNGYKNYLKFQRDQANQNFSALVKYQAHRHHKVDDIGKFILNKIPQIPQRRKRYFFDDSDMEEQDISTKSDDSWFKKHFYMFFDNGPQKKFHTSETVEFKDVTEASRGYIVGNVEKPGLKFTHGPYFGEISDVKEQSTELNSDEGQTVDINLDELSNVLEKGKASTVNPEIRKANEDTFEDGGLTFQVDAPNILNKLFGKGTRAPAKGNRKNYANTLKYNDDGSFIFNSDSDRFRRNAKHQIKVTEKEETHNLAHTTILNKQDNIKNYKTKSNEKIGCVNIVPQPTAIVNLHKANVKGSKIKRLLSKLHFYKKNKNHKKEKRHCTRVQRFNPIKKLKNMFKPKHGDGVVANNDAAEDYNVMTSHIDTFKPVKYDQIPSIDELRNQVPNISGDIAAKPTTSDNMLIAKPGNEPVREDTTKTSKSLIGIDTNDAEVEANPIIMSSTPPILQASKKQSKVKSYEQKKSGNQRIKDSFAVTDDLMNVNVKTASRLDNYFQPVTLENIRSATDKILIKLTEATEADFKAASSSSKNNMKTESNKKIKGHDKELNDDLTIKAKLTRVVKYPLVSRLNYNHNFYNINPVGDNTKLYEFIDKKNYLNVNVECSSYQRTPFFEIHYSSTEQNKATNQNPLIEYTLKNLEDVDEIRGAIRNNKAYPDYFHDLVMWNSDILNYDKVSNPTWQDILKKLETDQEFTTPNLKNMQKELSEMKEHLLHNNLSQIDGREDAVFRTVTEQYPLKISSPRYYAKADNIKVAVTTNKITNHPTIEHCDENLYTVPRNYPNKYAHVNSQDIIDVLNKLCTKKPTGITIVSNSESKRKNSKGPSKSTTDTHRKEPFDTSRMSSYSDEQLFLSDRWYPKKMSKNSITNFGRENKEPRPKSKLTQPKQYYNTPLPMKNEQFEMFLKENKLDVETVTFPMIEIPTVAETWRSRDNPLPKKNYFNKNMNKDTTTVQNTVVTDNEENSKVGNGNGMNEFIDKSYPENQIDYLNDLENYLLKDYRDKVNVRQKRSSVHDDNPFTDNVLMCKDKERNLKNKLNDAVFEKNSEEFTDMGKLNSATVTDENDFEITIINFDDVDKKSGYNKPDTNLNTNTLLKANSSIEDNTKTLMNADKSDPIKTQTQKQKKCQQLQSNEDDEKANLNNYSLLKLKDDSEGQGKIASTNLNQLPNELREKCKDKEGNLPKRVQISSHTYKYDVLYNVPGSKATPHNENKDGTTSAIVTEISDIKRYSDYNGKESPNSEIHQIMIVLNVANAVNDFTRPEVPIHLDLPTYYAPNTEIDSTKFLPVSLKTSWTDLVLKYISGIALIEMLNKLDFLKGGLNLTDGLDLSLDRDKVLSKDRVMSDGGNSRVDRAATTTKKRYTSSQTVHFKQEIIKQRNKRLFKILAVIKEKLKLFSKHKSTKLMMTPAKNNATNGSTKEVEFTNRSERNFENVDNNYDIFDYKGDIDNTMNVNKKTSEPTMQPIFIITNKHVDKPKTKAKIAPIDNEGVYIEEYDDGVYYEFGAKSNKSCKKTKTDKFNKKLKSNNKKNTNFNSYNKLKRDVSQETFTAKNVAALEVIVDLMKNTLNYEEKNTLKTFSQNNLIAAPHSKPRPNKNDNLEHITNSIQVHIAIPYDVPDKRRSLEPIKIRKVFSAKMATPVDLEYQIHSIEDNVATAAVTLPDLDYGLSPGMYLLVEDENNVRGRLTLKPVTDSSLQMRNTDEVTEKIAAATKSDKVQLSREFVAAVNKHLMQLYENMTAIENANKTHKVKRREASWERVKKLFDHDRVCNCKCKENKTMCRACAASDAVVTELTFEFDNLAKYMSDHCTEIQTFFWMNPTGGRKLRDAVRRIDKSLNDYYKRVKGKCRGRTCKTFATYIDKRNFDKNRKIERTYPGEPLIDDLKSLNNMFDISSNFIPYDETLKEKATEFVRTASNCIVSKPISKRSGINNQMKQKGDKNNVYTLDNINVNIICSPAVSSSSTNTSPINSVESTVNRGENNDILLDYDLNKRNCKKYKIKNPFIRKNKLKSNKLFTYYDTHVTAGDTFKRQAVYEQIESPIIADTGGSFWHDYLSKGNVDISNDNSKPNVEISVVQTNSDKTPSIRATDKPTELHKEELNNKNNNDNKVTVQSTTAKRQLTETLTDSLSYNMNELFKLIGTIKDVEEVRNTFTDTTMMATKHRTKKTKKHKKIHKTSKSKMHHKHKTKTTKRASDKLSTPTNTYNATSTSTTTIGKTANLKAIKAATKTPKTTETFSSFTVDEITASLGETKGKEKPQSTTTKKNLFDKIRKATLGFLSKIGKGNCVLDPKATKAGIDSRLQVAGNTKAYLNVITKGTTKMNPTILIINEDNTHDLTKQKSKYRNILLSLLNFESGKLNKEKNALNDEILEKGTAEANLVDNFSEEYTDDMDYAFTHLKLKSTKATPRHQSHQDKEYDVIRDLKTIRVKGPELELPAPPGLHSHPGIFEKITNKFGVKLVSEKVTVKPILSLTHNRLGMKKERPTKRKWTRYEEAGPIKTLNDDVYDHSHSIDLKRLSKGDERKYQGNSQKRSRRRKPRKRSNHLKIREGNIITTEDSGRINKKTFARATVKSRKRNRKLEFESYIREENGIYRLKRSKDDEESRNGLSKVIETNGKDDYVIPKVLQSTKSATVDLKKRKHKRSSIADRRRENIRLSMWLQHNTGFFLATATCLYIVFAMFAAVVNWLYR